MDASPVVSGAGRRVLEALVSAGPQTARELAVSLDVSPVAVRQQLTGLARDGLAAPDSMADGPGRPASRWAATPAAQGQLADAHQSLSVELLRTLGSLGLVDEVLERRTESQLRRYLELAGSCVGLVDRVQALARIRSDEGYMATAWAGESGAAFLAENHCPLHCAVQTCVGLCTAELELFRRFVGESVSVERTEHMGSGGRRCVYRFLG